MDLENDLTNELHDILGQRGFIMDRFLLRNISFSKEYAQAVEKKQVAMQDAVKKQYEADQIQKLASGEAARIRLLAQADADALELLGKALAKNPDVITLRYVDKLAPNIQVMLVPNNAPYILPLPSLSTVTPGTSPLVATLTPIPTLPNTNPTVKPTAVLPTPTPSPTLLP